MPYLRDSVAQFHEVSTSAHDSVSISAQVVELWSIANAKRKAAMAKEKTPAASKTSGVTRAEIADGTVVLRCPIIMLRCHIIMPYYNTAMPDYNALL